VLGRQQQFIYRDLQGSSKPVQGFDSWVFNPAFDPSDVRAVDTGVHRQCLLGQPAPYAKPPEIPSYQSRCLHWQNRRLCGLLKHAL